MIETNREFAKDVKNVDVDYNSVEEVVVSKEVSVDLRVMDSKALLMYFLQRFREVHGFQYRTDWAKEMAIMRSFKERYGPDAGLIIRCLFDDFKGKWGDQVASVTVFSKGSKWIQDQIYFRVTEQANKKQTPSVEGEMLNSDDFLNKFNTHVGK